MAKSLFEALPAELHTLILSQIRDLSSLKSIVHSSPTSHQVYVSARGQILSNVVKNEYGPLLKEALAALRSQGLLLSDYKEEAISLLDTWRRSEEISESNLSPHTRLDAPQDLEETLQLVRFTKLLHFFLHDFAMHSPRPPWIEKEKWGEMVPLHLSQVERHRFIRALCRMQLMANIFGRIDEGTGEGKFRWFDSYWMSNDPPPQFQSAKEEAYLLFWGTMPPWEYDEMGCVTAYLRTRFSSQYKEIYDDIHGLVKKYVPEDRIQYDQWDFIPSGHGLFKTRLNLLGDLKRMEYFTNSLIAIGPMFLNRFLHSDIATQRKMFLTNADPLWEPFIGHYSDLDVYGWDSPCPFIYPADRFAVRNYVEVWEKLPVIEQPNLGWKKLQWEPVVPGWQNQRPDMPLFEDAILGNNDELGWDWGNAIWDEERLRRWKAPILKGDQDDQTQSTS